MTEPLDDDPFTCPVCGGPVTCSSGGVKDCNVCPWDFRPARDTTSENSEQVGLGDY